MSEKFAHIVFFWLKEGTSEADTLKFENGLKKLGTSVCTSLYHWGKPLDIPKRGVVDQSYDYSITSFFDSLESHEVYQSTDPIHMEFIKTYKELWKDVKVFDSTMT